MQQFYRFRTTLIFSLAIFFSPQAEAMYMRDTNGHDLFEPYEVNSIMFRKSDHDDPASEINISMRYFFRASKSNAIATLGDFQPFFSYTGRFDFYWLLRNTRPSGPIISRYQNPALHLRRTISTDSRYKKYLDWYDIGFEHISNGQSLDAGKNQNLILAAYKADDRAVMDSISRVGATIAITLEGRKKFPKLLLGNDNEFLIKWYAVRSGQEADVFWGPHANEGLNYSDFQMFRAQWRVDLGELHGNLQPKKMPRQFVAEMNIGNKWFAEDSWNFMVNWPIEVDWPKKIPIGILPLTFTAHLGPLNTMSDYTRSQNSIAIGFAFSY